MVNTEIDCTQKRIVVQTVEDSPCFNSTLKFQAGMYAGSSPVLSTQRKFFDILKAIEDGLKYNTTNDHKWMVTF